MLASLLMAFYRYPIRGLLIFGGVTLLAPVIFPVASLLIRPLVKPVTNFYLDLAEDVTEAMQEREQQKERRGKKMKRLPDSARTEELEDAANVAVLIDTL
ncbi:MAG: hypothetical protein P8X65_03390 [Syntrophobacterales bacterium]|jgi:hypothetical protein